MARLWCREMRRSDDIFCDVILGSVLDRCFRADWTIWAPRYPQDKTVSTFERESAAARSLYQEIFGVDPKNFAP